MIAIFLQYSLGIQPKMHRHVTDTLLTTYPLGLALDSHDIVHPQTNYGGFGSRADDIANDARRNTESI